MNNPPYFYSTSEFAGGPLEPNGHDFRFQSEADWGVNQESNILAAAAEVDEGGHVFSAMPLSWRITSRQLITAAS